MLPAAAYTSAAVLAWERRHLFAGTWTCVGREADLRGGTDEPARQRALVVGDVVGHGLHAAATMGRLRTAVHNFSTLDLPPDELLSHLDELVGRIVAAYDKQGQTQGQGNVKT